MMFAVKIVRLVYIAEIAPDSLLLLSSNGQATCLRDYSRVPWMKATEDRTHSLDALTTLLAGNGNFEEHAPRHSTKDAKFWHDYISERNKALGLSASTGLVELERLLDRFQLQLAPLITSLDVQAITRVLEDWVDSLGAIEDKTATFNHWDHDDSTSKLTENSGLAWTAAMLEYCRRSATLDYIRMGDSSLDFALLAMDVNLKISSRRNPFRDGKGDQINPDGLGIRRDGSLCVLEMKAEDDREDMFRATIQALCGAVAIFAKREMILRIARHGSGLRPNASHAMLSEEAPSLGLYIVAADRHYARPDQATNKALSTLIEAWPPLEEIVFVSANREAPTFPAVLNTDLVLRS